MSDMGLGYDPFADMSEGDLIAMYAGMNPQLFGDDPAKRLNYLQDLSQTLGFDFVQTAGTTPAAQQAAQWQEPLNPTAEIYGTDPFYASIFQAIENGADPISAAKAAKDQLGFKGTQDEFNTQVVGVATQYASDRVRNRQERMNWERENADQIGGWTAPDGSKYKQTPLGGNDIRATASEFDLLGALNSETLLTEYARALAPQKTNVNTSGLPRSGSVQDYAASVAAGQGARLPGAGQAMGGWTVGGKPASEVTGGRGPQATSVFTNAGRRGNEAPVAGRDDGFFSKLDSKAKGSVDRRLDQAKQTRVRSDANINAMRRITALAGLLQGGFPE